VADRLMMSRIHRRRPPRPPRPPRRPGYDAVHPRMRLDPQGVAHASIGVVDRPGTLAREILIQGAAERDVQDLEATTNGEQREAAALGTCDERELDCVAPRVRFPELGVRLGPVAGGLDIFAAAEHEAL